MATCYRHSDRETGVSCSNCGRPICTDCMTATSVGMRCPECSKQTTKVRTVRNLSTTPNITYALIAINVLAAIGSGALFGGGRNAAWIDGALVGIGLSPAGELIGIAQSEYWRLVTGGFLHANLIHLLFNMWVLYWLGSELEPVLGRARFIALYFASMLAGSFGALLLDPQAFTVGASGAVFGLMGAAFVFQRAQGIDPMRTGLGPVILLNLALTFVIANISIGGHIGGLVGGALAALAMDRVRSPAPAIGVCAGVGVAAAAGGVWAAEREASDLGVALLSLLA